MNKVRLLITGSSGFIGSNLCTLLESHKDYYTIGIDKVFPTTGILPNEFIHKDLTIGINEDINFDICEIKRNNNYINKSSSGFITWNIYVDNFTESHDGTVFYFINSTGKTQEFYFKGETNLILYDIEFTLLFPILFNI